MKIKEDTQEKVCAFSIFSFSQSSQLDMMFHSFELHLAFILSHKHHFSLVWLFSCLKSPKENEKLEVKNHTYSLPILHPHYTPGRDSIVFFLIKWNRHWVKTQNQEETWVLQDGGRWSHLGEASWQREAGLATERGRCGLGQCGQEEWGKHGSQAAPPALSRASSKAFRGACHSAVLFLVMIYSTAAVSENIQAAGLFSKDPVCRRTWSAVSRYRLELYWMLILMQIRH